LVDHRKTRFGNRSTLLVHRSSDSYDDTEEYRLIYDGPAPYWLAAYAGIKCMKKIQTKNNKHDTLQREQ